MKKTDIKSPAMLFLAAFIWGVAFVAQSVGMDYVGPFTFNTVRSIIGGLVLIPCIFFLGKKERGVSSSVLFSFLLSLAVSRKNIRIPEKIWINTNKHAFWSNFFFCVCGTRVLICLLIYVLLPAEFCPHPVHIL